MEIDHEEIRGIPDDKITAAEKIHQYTVRSGWKDWEFMALADRRLVTRLQLEITELKIACERMGSDASTIQNLTYGNDGDCGAVKIAERIEYECDQILLNSKQ